MPAQKKYIGIDGGGTKSVCVIGTADGNVEKIAFGKSTNIQVKPFNEVQFVLLNLVQDVMTQSNTKPEQLHTVYLSLAGCGRDQDQKRIKDALRPHLPKSCRLIVSHDAMGALAAGTWGKPGMILIAGTGSIVYVLNRKDELLRVGGWGYLLGDEGSGFDIGKQAITAMLRQFDGRGSHTTLSKAILDHYQLKSPEAFIPFVYGLPDFRERIAELSTLVFQRGRAGDVIARNIIMKARGYLLELVETASRLFEGDPLPIVLCGGLFQDQDFRKCFANRVRRSLPSCKLLFPDLPPAAGAFLLSLRSAGVLKNGEAKESLQRSWKRL